MADDFPYSQFLVESDPTSDYLFDGQLLPAQDEERQEPDSSANMDGFPADDFHYHSHLEATIEHIEHFDTVAHMGMEGMQQQAPVDRSSLSYDTSDMSRNNSLANSDLAFGGQNGHDSFHGSPNTSYNTSCQPTPALTRNNSDLGQYLPNGEVASGRKRRRNAAVSYTEPDSDAELSNDEYEGVEHPPRRRMKSTTSSFTGIVDNPIAEQVRERNRLAATKCRNKKKAEAEILRMSYEGMVHERNHFAHRAQMCEHEISKMWCLLNSTAKDEYLKMSGGNAPPGVTLSAAYAHLHGAPVPGATGPPPSASAHPPYPPPGMATTFVAADGVSYMLQRRESEDATAMGMPPPPPPTGQASSYVMPVIGHPPPMGPMSMYSMQAGPPHAPLKYEEAPAQHVEGTQQVQEECVIDVGSV